MPFSPSLPTRQQVSAGRSAKTAIVALHHVTGAAGTVRDTIPVDPAERQPRQEGDGPCTLVTSERLEACRSEAESLD
jgi:hypothetical protein